jgi:hypothetical protein
LYQGKAGFLDDPLETWLITRIARDFTIFNDLVDV